MIIGQFRGAHPRVTLTLPGRNGSLTVEFIVDTGFKGDLAIPFDLAQQLEASDAGPAITLMVDGSLARCPSYLIAEEDLALEWELAAPRPVEVLVLQGRPLLGTQLLRGYFLQIEVTEGGEVALEPV